MIYKADAADIETIRQIAFETWPVAYGSILSQQQLHYMLDMMYNADVLLTQMKEGHHFFLAAKAGKAIGFAGCSTTEESGMYKLHKLYVLPTVQKSGAGKALLQQVIVQAKADGAHQLILQVNRHNNAQQFYAHHGFTVLYEKAFDIGAGYVMDDYVMGLDL